MLFVCYCDWVWPFIAKTDCPEYGSYCMDPVCLLSRVLHAVVKMCVHVVALNKVCSIMLTEQFHLFWSLLDSPFSRFTVTPVIYRHWTSFTVTADLIYRFSPHLWNFIYRFLFQILNRRLCNGGATYSNQTGCYGRALSLAFTQFLNELQTLSRLLMISQKLTEARAAAILIW